MKKGIIVLTLVLLVVLPYASAGLFDFWKEDVQLAPSDTQEFDVTLGNSAPTVTILAVENNDTISMDDAVDLVPATVTGVNVSFSVTDLNGASDIDGSTLVVSLGLSGDATRSITGISSCGSSDSGNTRYYNCTVDVQFYDGASAAWNANVTIDDIAAAPGQDLVHTFTVNQLKDISASPATVSFAAISVGSVNTTSSVDTTIINNGNFEVPGDGSLTITNAALVGQTNALQSIGVSDFRSVATAEFSDFCGSGTGLGGVAHDGTAQNVPSDSLPKSSDGSASTEDYRHCIVSHSVTQAQVYSTVGYTPWTFGI